ncbi:hypothetical protein [Aestuariimicrobium ganziense]|nr:hypothetical protein [Aestuariimicrobium ganziense]
MLRQQGRAATSRCLDKSEVLSPGQAELIAAARERFGWLLDEDRP